MIFHAYQNAFGGEIFVPKIPSYRILDLAEAIGPECEKPIVGIRPGEKIHEEMISFADSMNTYDMGKYYVILPNEVNWDLQKYLKLFNGAKVKEYFSYNSGTNSEWESIESLRHKITKHVDQNFFK